MEKGTLIIFSRVSNFCSITHDESDLEMSKVTTDKTSRARIYFKMPPFSFEHLVEAASTYMKYMH